MSTVDTESLQAFEKHWLGLRLGLVSVKSKSTASRWNRAHFNKEDANRLTIISTICLVLLRKTGPWFRLHIGTFVNVAYAPIQLSTLWIKTAAIAKI